MMLEILPTRASYGPEDSIDLEVRGLLGAGELSVWHLGECIERIACECDGIIAISPVAVGGYGIELSTESTQVRTAIEVTEHRRNRLRYGFVTNYSPNRDLSAISDNIRRLHLNGIQFYDWAYRHADLLGGGDEYFDALDQPIALQSVRDLVSTVKEAGASALGYAAVYAVGPKEWPQWKHQALLTGTGDPYALGDFLFLVDPASAEWLTHFTGQLEQSIHEIGFDGFHLDQYGYPKRALRADGKDVDVSDSFTKLIAEVRDVLPDSHLVFNNVNDFPSWKTAHSPQDAMYIEVWPPHVTLNSLAQVVNRAKVTGEGKPVVIAAYQHVYDTAPTSGADLATAFTMATLFSHGASQILVGEADRILVDPYYVRNHQVKPSTANLLKNWYNFLVEHDELLLDPSVIEVTNSYAGSYNDDCDVTFEQARVTEMAEAGAVWRRITCNSKYLVVHLINLVGQDDILWDSQRNTPSNPGASFLRVRRIGEGLPRVRVTDPDGSHRLIEVPVNQEGGHAIASLPPLNIWQLVLIDLNPSHDESRPLD